MQILGAIGRRLLLRVVVGHVSRGERTKYWAILEEDKKVEAKNQQPPVRKCQHLAEIMLLPRVGCLFEIENHFGHSSNNNLIFPSRCLHNVCIYRLFVAYVLVLRIIIATWGFPTFLKTRALQYATPRPTPKVRPA